MTWTSEKPSKEGWYWWRHNSKRKPSIIAISDDHIRKDDVFTVGTLILFIDELPGEWSSTPIPEPTNE